jgi:hypothetical protein
MNASDISKHCLLIASRVRETYALGVMLLRKRKCGTGMLKRTEEWRGSTEYNELD